MSKFLFLVITILTGLSASLHAQWEEHSFNFEGHEREYRVYTPPSYDESKPGKMVLSLHGLGTSLNSWQQTVKMSEVADTTNLIIVTPEALPSLFGTAWNSGAGINGWYYPNSDINDVGFLSEVIDRVIDEVPSINPEYVFATGFSMGGFMTQRLAIELNGKITAFASAAGTVGHGIIPPSNPGRSVPILHFHGTSDAVVPHINNTWGWDADEILSFWINNNNVPVNPEVIEIDDTGGGGYTVTHYIWDNGDLNSRIEYFEVHNLEHIWLGFSHATSYTLEAWRFFNLFIDNEEMRLEDLTDSSFASIYPNPASDKIYIRWNQPDFEKAEISIYNLLGEKVLLNQIIKSDSRSSINISHLTAGTYIIQIKSGDGLFTEKVLIK